LVLIKVDSLFYVVNVTRLNKLKNPNANWQVAQWNVSEIGLLYDFCKRR
jgi:hypothetical protein